MFDDDAPILPDGDAIGIGVDFDRCSFPIFASSVAKMPNFTIATSLRTTASEPLVCTQRPQMAPAYY
jgi:hypothetical protein